MVDTPKDENPDEINFDYVSDISWMTRDDQQVVLEQRARDLEFLREYERRRREGTLPPPSRRHRNQPWPIGMLPDGSLNVTRNILENWKPGDKPIDLRLKKWKEEADRQERQRLKVKQRQEQKAKRRAFLRRMFKSQ